MSIRYFCDVCGQEGEQFDRVRRRLGDVMIEIMVRYKGTWNAGHVCASCAVRVAREGEPVADGESWIADQAREREKERARLLTAPPMN